MNPLSGEVEEFDEEFDEEVEEMEYIEDGEEDDETDGELNEDEEGDEVRELPQSAPYIRGLEPLHPSSADRASPSSSRQQPAQEWEGLNSLQAPIQKVYKELLDKLRADNKNRLTILLLGKDQVGKSTLVNALLNETAIPPSFGQQRGGSRPRTISRVAAGFTLSIVDTPGLPEDGSNTDLVLRVIAAELRGRQVDVVLYVDRLDQYRVDSADRQVIDVISNEYGSAFWNHAIIVFSHGRLTTLPENYSYGDYLHQRSLSLRSAIRKASGNRTAALPAVAVENGWKTDLDDEDVKVLPDGTRWLASLMTQVVETSQNGPWRFDPARRQNPDRRNRKWIPLVLAAQLAFKFLVLDRILEEDGVRGDQWGPFDDKLVRMERRRRAQAKESKKAAKDASRSSRTNQSPAQFVDDDDEFEDDF